MRSAVQSNQTFKSLFIYFHEERCRAELAMMYDISTDIEKKKLDIFGF